MKPNFKNAAIALIGALTIAAAANGNEIVEAATEIIGDYHTHRGDVAVIKREEVHVNRIALTIDGEPTWAYTLYLPEEGATFVPLRFVSEQLGGEVEYESRIQTAHIKRGDACASDNR